MLNWFKKKPEPPRAVLYGRAVGYCLDWWLLCLEDEAHSYGRDERVLEFVANLLVEGKSIRNSTCRLANLLAGDLIVSRPADVRAEVLEYIRRPRVWDSFLNVLASDVATGLDTAVGPHMGEEAMGGGVRPLMRASVLERTDASDLSPQAFILYAGFRHLFERSLVALDIEREDEELRWMVRRLSSECIYALEGCDAETRRARHAVDERADVATDSNHAATDS